MSDHHHHQHTPQTQGQAASPSAVGSPNPPHHHHEVDDRELSISVSGGGQQEQSILDSRHQWSRSGTYISRISNDHEHEHHDHDHVQDHDLIALAADGRTHHEHHEDDEHRRRAELPSRTPSPSPPHHHHHPQPSEELKEDDFHKRLPQIAVNSNAAFGQQAAAPAFLTSPSKKLVDADGNEIATNGKRKLPPLNNNRGTDDGTGSVSISISTSQANFVSPQEYVESRTPGGHHHTREAPSSTSKSTAGGEGEGKHTIGGDAARKKVSQQTELMLVERILLLEHKQKNLMYALIFAVFTAVVAILLVAVLWGGNPNHWGQTQIIYTSSQDSGNGKLTNGDNTTALQFGQKGITNFYMADLSINETNLDDLSVSTRTLSDGSVTSAKLEKVSLTEFVAGVIADTPISLGNQSSFSSTTNIYFQSNNISFTSGSGGTTINSTGTVDIITNNFITNSVTGITLTAGSNSSSAAPANINIVSYYGNTSLVSSSLFLQSTQHSTHLTSAESIYLAATAGEINGQSQTTSLTSTGSTSVTAQTLALTSTDTATLQSTNDLTIESTGVNGNTLIDSVSGWTNITGGAGVNIASTNGNINFGGSIVNFYSDAVNFYAPSLSFSSNTSSLASNGTASLYSGLDLASVRGFTTLQESFGQDGSATVRSLLGNVSITSSTDNVLVSAISGEIDLTATAVSVAANGISLASTTRGLALSSTTGNIGVSSTSGNIAVSTTSGSVSVAGAGGVSISATSGSVTAAGTGVALSTSTGSVTLASTGGIALAETKDINLTSSTQAIRLQSSNAGVTLSSSIGLTASSDLTFKSTTGSASFQATAGDFNVSASTGVHLTTTDDMVCTSDAFTTTARLVQVTSTASTTITAGTSLKLSAPAVSVDGPFQQTQLTINTASATTYTLDFSTVKQSVLKFTGTPNGAVTFTVTNCDASHSGMDIKLINGFSNSTSDSIYFAKSTCMDQFSSTVTVGNYITISCLGSQVGTSSIDKVFCTRPIGSSAGLVGINATGTIASGTSSPGSVTLNAAAGQINLVATTGLSYYNAGSFWFLNNEVTSAHVGASFTSVYSGSSTTQPAVITIVSQKLVSGYGILCTVWNSGGSLSSGDTISFVFQLI